MEVQTFFKAPVAVKAARRGLRAVSKKRRRQEPTRRKVRDEVLARDGGCVAAEVVWWVPCERSWLTLSGLEIDERIGRGRGGDPLDPSNAQALCRAHHQWKHDHPAKAWDLGLSDVLPPRGSRLLIDLPDEEEGT